MKLRFTKDIGTRYKKGDIKEYGRSTWKAIEGNVGRPLATFTEGVAGEAEAIPQFKRKRGRPKKAPV